MRGNKAKFDLRVVVVRGGGVERSFRVESVELTTSVLIKVDGNKGAVQVWGLRSHGGTMVASKHYVDGGSLFVHAPGSPLQRMDLHLDGMISRAIEDVVLPRGAEAVVFVKGITKETGSGEFASWLDELLPRDIYAYDRDEAATMIRKRSKPSDRFEFFRPIDAVDVAPGLLDPASWGVAGPAGVSVLIR